MSTQRFASEGARDHKLCAHCSWKHMLLTLGKSRVLFSFANEIVNGHQCNQSIFQNGSEAFCFLSTKWYALEIYPNEQVCVRFSVIIQDMGFINYFFLKSKMKLLLGFPSAQYYWITWGSPRYPCSFSSCLTSHWMFSVLQHFDRNIHVNFNSYFPWSNLITYSLSIKKVIISWLLRHYFLFKQIQSRVIHFRMPHY